MIVLTGFRPGAAGARHCRRYRKAGFTLLETLVVVAIIGLMAVIAVPWFQRIRQRYLVKSAAFEIQSSLLAARMRAVKRNSQVTVVITAAGPSQPNHEIDVIEAAPATNSTSLISAKSVDLATLFAVDPSCVPPPWLVSPGPCITFKGDGSVAVPPPPAVNTIVISGPPGAIAPNKIKIDTSPNGRVQVTLPTNWN